MRDSTPPILQFPDTFLRTEILPGFAELVEAYDFATARGLPLWDFAVDRTALTHAGVSDTELRKLIHSGYLLHKRETTPADGATRTFARGNPAVLGPRSCFVLSATGAKMLRRDLQNPVRHHPTQLAVKAPKRRHRAKREVPRWNAEDHELWFRNRMAKKFRRPATYMEKLLRAFQRAGWQSCIKSPFGRLSNKADRRWLHDLIQRLNCSLRECSLRFHGDGTGKGIYWNSVD